MIFGFASLLFPLFFAVGALAQATVINVPKPGARIRNGQTFTVQILRPMSHQGSIEVGYAIGLLPCGKSPCPPASEQVGRLLYNGPYRPQLQELPGRPYQNFTLTMPPADEFPKGIAQLSTVRLHLIGAGPSPTFEVQNVTIRVI